MLHRRILALLLSALVLPFGVLAAPGEPSSSLVLAEGLVGSVLLRGTPVEEGCAFEPAPMSIDAGHGSVLARLTLGPDCALVLEEYRAAPTLAAGDHGARYEVLCRHAPCPGPGAAPRPSLESVETMAEDEADAADQAVEALLSEDCRDPGCRPDAKAATGDPDPPAPLSGCTWQRAVTGRLKTEKTWLKVDARFNVGCSSPARSQVTPILGTCRAPGWRFEVIACREAARVTPAWPDSTQWGITGSYYKNGRQITFWHGMTDVLEVNNAGSLRCHVIINGDTPGGRTWYCGDYFY